MQKFGAYLHCFKSPFSTYKCLESFRKYYPDSSIVMLSDNGYDYTEMAKHFNCIYIHSNENNSLCVKNLDNVEIVKNKVYNTIDRFTNAFNLIKEDYVMWLEDDVIINNKVTDTFKFDINGFCPNKYPLNMKIELNKTYPSLNIDNTYRWSGHGGSIINRKTMLDCFKNKNIIDDILINWKKYNLTDDICHDFLFSLIVNLNNGTIGPYNGHYDDYSNEINTDIVVQHQYKKYYKYEMPNELKNLVKIV